MPRSDISPRTSQVLIVCFRRRDAWFNCPFALPGVGALGKPIKRDNADEGAIVWKTVTVYATNIASGSFLIVTVSEAIYITKSVTEAAILIPPSGAFNKSAVYYSHQLKWSTYNTTTSAVCDTTTRSVPTYASATQPATTAIPIFKLHAFATDAPWLSKALSTATLTPTKTIPKPKLHSKAYTNVGCAFADDPKAGNNTPYQGLWVCEFS